MINRHIETLSVKDHGVSSKISIERCTITDDFIVKNEDRWNMRLALGDMLNLSTIMRDISMSECLRDIKMCDENLKSYSAGRSLVGGYGDGGDMTVPSLVPPSPLFLDDGE